MSKKKVNSKKFKLAYKILKILDVLLRLAFLL